MKIRKQLIQIPQDNIKGLKKRLAIILSKILMKLKKLNYIIFYHQLLLITYIKVYLKNLFNSQFYHIIKIKDFLRKIF